MAPLASRRWRRSPRCSVSLAKFLTKLEVQSRDDGRWILLNPLVYQSDIPEVWMVTVPAGFDTDFASVPRLPFMFWLLGDRADHAATIHDYLYRMARVSRALADRTFVEAAGVEGVSWLARWTMWTGLRVGGWAAYDQRHPSNKETT